MAGAEPGNSDSGAGDTSPFSVSTEALSKLSELSEHSDGGLSSDIEEPLGGGGLVGQLLRLQASAIRWATFLGLPRTAPTTESEVLAALMTSMLGPGFFFLPAAFAHAGALTGLALLVLVAAANRCSLMLLFRAGTETLERPSYAELARQAFGPKGRRWVFAAYLGTGGFVLVSSLTALTDLLGDLSALSTAPRLLQVALGAGLCAVPLTSRSFKPVALVSLGCVLAAAALACFLTMVRLRDIFNAPADVSSDVVQPLLASSAAPSPASAANAASVVAAVPTFSWLESDPRKLAVALVLFSLHFATQAGGLELMALLPPHPAKGSHHHQDLECGEPLSEDGLIGGAAGSAHLLSSPEDPRVVAAAEGTRLAFGAATLLSAVIGLTGAGYCRPGIRQPSELFFDMALVPGIGWDMLALARALQLLVAASTFTFMLQQCRYTLCQALFGSSREWLPAPEPCPPPCPEHFLNLRGSGPARTRSGPGSGTRSRASFLPTWETPQEARPEDLQEDPFGPRQSRLASERRSASLTMQGWLLTAGILLATVLGAWSPSLAGCFDWVGLASVLALTFLMPPLFARELRVPGPRDSDRRASCENFQCVALVGLWVTVLAAGVVYNFACLISR